MSRPGQKSRGWKKTLQRYIEPNRKEDSDKSLDDDYEYIVEKLAVKYVPTSLIDTPRANLGGNRQVLESQDSETSTSTTTSASSVEKPKNGYAARASKKLTELSKKLSVVKREKTAGSKRPKPTREPPPRAPPSRRPRQMETINRLTAFHPHLKDSDIPPKEPKTLDFKTSGRLFAEELSEIASRINSESVNTDTNTTNDNILFKMPSTSNETSF